MTWIHELSPNKRPSIQWDREGILATSHRPSYPLLPPDNETVGIWIEAVLAAGIRSVLPILEYKQLDLYEGGLLELYRSHGLKTAHVPARDNKLPPLSSEELEAVWVAFQSLETPVLVHCNAGINRTGAAVHYILAKLDGRKP
ncbi:MAG: hypothetical protein BZY82_01290 [SAR202 cluster bacterium Io17-Chloro-G3]|nr:MAG: hypothetical protein BZY82_01290 [SAR202 cluster bacterium Io17-Chloro-G3]